MDVNSELECDYRDNKTHRCWVFTLNNPAEHGWQSEHLLDQFAKSANVIYGAFSLEKGKRGTLHWQGWCKTKPTKFGYMKKNFMDGKCYWAPGKHNADDLQRDNYVKKQPIDGPWEYGKYVSQGHRTDLEAVFDEVSLDDVIKKHPGVYAKYHAGIDKVFNHRKQVSAAAGFAAASAAEVAAIESWHPWQEDVLYLAALEPHRREIYWFWDQNGNVGKSTIADVLITDYEAYVLSGKVSDMRYAYSTKLSPVVVFDLCRTQADCLTAFAHFCEELKNGRYMCGKYESKQILFRRPSIFVFANFEYPGGFFSADRVKCHDVSKYPVCLYG